MTDAKCSDIDYVIATTGRTGSNLLVRLLKNNGLGDPSEFFNQKLHGFRRAAEDGTSCEQWLEKMRRERTVNGVFGVKIIAYQPVIMRPFMEMPVQEDFDVLRTLLPDAKYIFLWREDVDRQAISFFRAKTTNEWLITKDHLGKEKRTPPPLDVEFVEQDIKYINTFNEKWRTFFDKYGIDPYCVTYETLDANRERVIKEIASFLGRPIEGRPALEVDIVRQADELTEQYLRELREHRRLAGSRA